MDIKKISTKIIAFLLAICVILGITASLNAISSADDGDFIPVEVEKHVDILGEDNFTDNNKGGEPKLPPDNIDQPKKTEAEKKTEGKSGETEGGSGVILNPRLRAPIVLDSITQTQIIAENGTYTFTGTKKDALFDVIVVNPGLNAVTIVLNDVTITTDDGVHAPIGIAGGGSKVTVKLNGTNKLHAAARSLATGPTGLPLNPYTEYSVRAGLEVIMGSTLIIDGPGSLHAQSANDADEFDPGGGYGVAAGIGGGQTVARAPGNIVIKGGTITAVGGQHGSGIGAGHTNGSYYSHILIIGGTVDSTGGRHGNGIGGSCGSPGTGVLVAVPPASVTVRSMITTTTELGWTDRANYADIGSMGTIFFMGAEVKEGSTAFNTIAMAPSGNNFKVHPATIQTEEIVDSGYTGGVDLYLDIYSDAAARAEIQPALDLYDGDKEAFFSKLNFGNIAAGKDKVQRIAYLSVPGKIITTTPPTGGEIGDELFLANTIKKTGEGDGNTIINAGTPSADAPLKGEYKTELAPLLFPQFKFEKGILSTGRKLMYGFNEAEAKANENSFKFYNEEVKKTVTVGGITLSDQIVSGSVRKLTLTPDDAKSKTNFSYNDNIVTTDYEITESLESVPNAETTASAWGKLDIHLNPMLGGKNTKVGTYAGSGNVTGRRIGENDDKDIDFSQEVIAGNYIDGGFAKDPADPGTTIPSTDDRITGHVKVTATPGPLPAPGQPINIIGNKVTLDYEVIDSNINPAEVVVSYIIREKGAKLPLASDPEWKAFSKGTVVSFPENTEKDYVIFYNVENTIFNLRSGFDYYDADLVNPKVTSVIHQPNPQGELGIISTLDETIKVKFSEAVTGFDEADVEILIDGKKSTAISIVPGSLSGSGTDYSFDIRADETKLNGNEKVEINILKDAAKDRLGNPSLSSKDGNSGLKLDYNSGKPSAKISHDIGGSKVIFNEKLTQIEVAVTANDTTKNGKLFTDSGAGNQVTPSHVTGNQGIYKDFIEVVDKDGNPVNYTLTYVDEPGKGGKFVVSFPGGGLDDGDYKVIVNEDKIFNQQGETVIGKEGDFSVKIPQFDNSAGKGAVIDKVDFDEKGGVANITIIGKNLDQAQSITIKEILKNQATKINDIKVVSKDPNKIVIQVPIPENKNFDIHEYYKFQATLVNPVNPALNQTIDVVIETDTTRPAEVEVFRAKSILKFDMNGGGPQVKDIVADKDVGNKSGKFDFSNYEIGKPEAPKKANHMFLGWYDKDGNKVKNNIELTAKGGVYTLTAKWLDMSTAIDGGDGDLGETVIDAEQPDADVAKYPGNNTVEAIEKELGGKVTIEIPGESPIVMHSEFIWDNTDMNDPGVKIGNVYLTNPITGEKVKQKDPVYAYITARAYISNRDFVSFEQYSQYTENGSEWSPRVVEEVPDRVNHRIVIKNHPTVFNPNGLNTELMGSYFVKFSATITTYQGQSYVVPPTSGEALVLPRDEAAAAEIAAMAAEDKFWVNAARSLHLLDANTSWQIDRTNYHNDGSKVGNISRNKNYDRIMTVEANGYPRMSAEVLQMLKEQDNTQLVVKYGPAKWEFHSKDFKNNGQKEPTGYFNLGVKTGNENETLNKLLGTRAQLQVKFEMNNNIMGKTRLTLDLNKDLREKANLNLFSFNEGSGQVELVGKMVNNKDGTASITLKEVRGTYVILDGLSKSTSTKAVAAKPEEKVLSYRITDMTNEFDAKTKQEIEKDLASVGKNIKSITAQTADDITLKTIEADKGLFVEKKSNNGLIAVVIVGAILLGGLGLYLYSNYNKKEKKK